MRRWAALKLLWQQRTSRHLSSSTVARLHSGKRQWQLAIFGWTRGFFPLESCHGAVPNQESVATGFELQLGTWTRVRRPPVDGVVLGCATSAED